MAKPIETPCADNKNLTSSGFKKFNAKGRLSVALPGSRQTENWHSLSGKKLATKRMSATTTTLKSAVEGKAQDMHVK